MLFRWVHSLLLGSFFASFTAADEIPDFPAEHIAQFEAEVAGILEANCLKCHAGDKTKGGLDLARRETILKGGESGPAVDLADSATSLLIQAINYDGFERCGFTVPSILKYLFA